MRPPALSIDFVYFEALNSSCHRFARRRWGLFCGEYGQRNGLEAVVVRPLRVVEQDLARFPELVALYVEFVVQVLVEGYV